MGGAGRDGLAPEPDPRDVALHGHPGDATPGPDPDPGPPREGDIWGIGSPRRSWAFLPDRIAPDDPWPWRQMWPIPGPDEEPWHHGRDLPGGLELLWRDGGSVAR